MQTISTPAPQKAEHSLCPVIGVAGAPNTLRVKAMLAFAVDDALQPLNRQAAIEFGLKISRHSNDAKKTLPGHVCSASIRFPLGLAVGQDIFKQSTFSLGVATGSWQ